MMIKIFKEITYTNLRRLKVIYVFKTGDTISKSRQTRTNNGKFIRWISNKSLIKLMKSGDDRKDDKAILFPTKYSRKK
ncbi:hypothetical protein [Candidatus Nitrosocosmicus franklandus]|uniref:Uncharacterized protein n=1 Tax=Candidatus Nitrosocosmicus franklandianus TaxID=1798806 RepID=A0A484IAA9_9ARCH|nr:hypothetical protein [Candidatus Nitrosocosmicus franklandus]VFJ14183.1 protein of unknown function [Candidatus Nitrosocosmicus franklandus]